MSHRCLFYSLAICVVSVAWPADSRMCESTNLPFAASNRLLAILPGFPAGGFPDCQYRIQVVGKPSEMRFPTPRTPLRSML